MDFSPIYLLEPVVSKVLRKRSCLPVNLFRNREFMSDSIFILNEFEVLYMSSIFWLLGVRSRDFSQAEKERTACKAGQIHKMTTIFTKNDNLGPF